MALSRPADHVGRVLGDRYRLVDRLGTGASAEVYLADDERLGRRVAVKMLHPALAADETFLRRFQAEARAAAALNHPNLLAVYDWGSDATPYLVTEYLSGGSLRAILDDHGLLTPSQALMVGLEAARGLDFAHSRGFVHRDIKPANLLFGEDGRLRIADFGLARALAEAAWTEPAGTVVGTVRYASPEQVSGERVDGAADMYSLALVLIESVSGEVPFSGDTAVATMMGRLEHGVKVPDSLGSLQPILAATGAVDPSERPTAKQFGSALLAAAEDLGAPAPLMIAKPELDASPSLSTSPVIGHTRTFGPVGDAVSDSSVMLPHGAVDGSPRPDLAVVSDQTMLAPGSTGSIQSGPASLSELAASVQDEDLERAGFYDGAPSGRQGRAKRRRRGGRFGRVMKIVAFIGVFALAGLVAAALLLPEKVRTYDVPELAGADAESVGRIVEPFGWEVRILEDYSADRPSGEIISQVPAQGTPLEEGGLLTITRSLGPELVDVPTGLDGQSLEEVTRQLEDTELAVGSQTPEPSEDILADHVIRLDTTESSLPMGSTVDLVVSSGPAPRMVPEGLVGMAFEDAEAALVALNLLVIRTDDFSDTVPAGAVISHDPPIGTELPRDGDVNVLVSKGIRYIEVPNVVGLDAAEAANLLEADGFRTGDTVGPPNKPVLATDPPAGEFHAPGKSVRIITRSS